MSKVVAFQKPSIARLECSACGASADAACNCGVPYLPAGARAAAAVAANPEKSNGVLAMELGVSDETVRRARKSTSTNVEVEPRIGLDGKVRKLPTPKTKGRKVSFRCVDQMPTEEEAEVCYQQTLYDQACLLLSEMADETRQKFFAHIKRKYHDAKA